MVTVIEAVQCISPASLLYDPIPESSHEIRIIILHPPSPDPRHEHEIRCSLVRESLKCNPEYEALSYAWGKAGASKYIFVNGLEVSVRENLWDALFHLRQSRDRRLWIDAICINQTNIAERNHQVQQMNRIYIQASRVLIWLGLESEDSKEALDFLKSGGSTASSVDFTQFIQKTEAVFRLLDRPYWRRLWIIQEVVLAKEARIQCGRDHISWDHFSSFRVRWEEAAGIADMEVTRRQLAYLRSDFAFELDRYRLREETNLRELLQSFQASLCSDIRDKVYGLAGLAKDGQELRINYSKSLYELFADVLLLQRGAQSALLIAFARFLQRVLDIHPWDHVPDLESLSEKLIRTIGRKRGKIYLLGPQLADFDRSRQGLDVEVTSGPLSEWNIGNLLSLKACCRIKREVIAVYSPISYGLHDQLRPAPLSRNYYNATGSSTRRLNVPNAPQTRQLTQRLQAKQKIDEVAAQEYGGAAPQFFLDNRGRVGLVPSNARVGDTICGFDDSNILAVLRWTEGRYVFVGRMLFVQLTLDNQVRFISPMEFNSTGSIEMYMNAHTVYLLTK